MTQKVTTQTRFLKGQFLHILVVFNPMLLPVKSQSEQEPTCELAGLRFGRPECLSMTQNTEKKKLHTYQFVHKFVYIFIV